MDNGGQPSEAAVRIWKQNDSLNISVIRPISSAPARRKLRLAAPRGHLPQLGVTSGMWGGTFLVEPGARTGIHHHGSQETIVYVLEGESCVEWGEHGEHYATVRAGDFLHVPAGLPHREINPSKDKPFRWVVIRSTSEPIVVNLPDDYWTATDRA